MMRQTESPFVSVVTNILDFSMAFFYPILRTLLYTIEKELSLKDFFCTKVLPELLFVSNRHFRTPFIPEILTSIINEKK